MVTNNPIQPANELGEELNLEYQGDLDELTISKNFIKIESPKSRAFCISFFHKLPKC